MTDTRNLTFLDNVVPVVETGDYTITITQTPKGDGIPDGTKFTLDQELTVTGLRLHAEADEIHGAYPPAGTAGRFAQFLPHVALERRGVPWERRIASADDGTTPWLGVLLFAEGELPDDPKALGATENGNAETLLTSGGDQMSLPDFTTIASLTEQEKKQTIATIRVPKEVFVRVAPTSAELPFLAHVRSPLGTEASQAERRDAEYAYVLANRFPDPAGGRYVAHLVSFEGHKALLDAPSTAKDHVRLVSLHHWSFVSAPVAPGAAYSDLRARLTAGDPRPHLLQHPGPKTYGEESELDAYTKRVRYLVETGHVALGHVRADREDAYAFYRGPLTPYPVTPVSHTGTWWKTAEDGFGVASVGHETAWNLGRGLALADQEFAAALARTLDLRHRVALDLAQIVGGLQARASALGVESADDAPATALMTLMPPEHRLHLPLGEALSGAGPEGTEAEWRAGARALDRVLAGEPPRFHAYALLEGLTETADSGAGDGADVEEDPVTALRAGDLSFPATTPEATGTVAEIADDPSLLGRFVAHVLGTTSEPHSTTDTSGGVAVGGHAPAAEPALSGFLDELRTLTRVPFDHLVPDVRALPVESARWFRVDPDWLDALVTGALWAGICSSLDRTAVEKLVSAYLKGSPPTPRSGLIIRSRLVADYPRIGITPSKAQVSGEDLKDPKVLRRVVLAPGVLLVLFDGVPKEVYLTEPDQGVHLGIGTHEQKERITLRALKKVDTVVIGDEVPDGGGVKRVEVAFRDGGGRVLDLKGAGALLTTIWDGLGAYQSSDGEGLSPGEFGLQLVHSPEKAVLSIPPAPGEPQGSDEGARA
ncbi:hypothetical protein ACIQFP_14910 [Nocardiopsis alba]|uniref:hypothetical protein n=1 Tax=Nocardiopsis alba TaxID=53437 RepID=UPI0037F91B57